MSVGKTTQAVRGHQEYEQLPRMPKTWGSVTKKVQGFVQEFFKTILFPFMLLIESLVSLFPRKVLQITALSPNKISPLAQQRLQETELKIQAVAQKAGFAHPQNVKLMLYNKLTASPAAIGAACTEPTFLASPEWLIKPEDLPDHLKLERLEGGMLSEETWVTQFEEWIWNDFLHVSRPDADKKKSQYGVDKRHAVLKIWLHCFRDQEKYDKIFEFISGHELGHMHHAHGFVKALVRFAWRIACIASCGLLAPLTKKVMNAFSRMNEQEADMFSAEKTGQAEYGGKFFDYAREEAKKRWQKYPEIHKKMTEEGDPIEGTHPPLSERSKYLRAFALAYPLAHPAPAA